MSLRRTLSGATQLEMQMQAVLAENARLRESVAAFERGQAGATAPAVSEPVMEAAVTMSELLQCEERQHPASTPKKKSKAPRRSKKGYLRGVPAGSLLTQPHIIQLLLEQQTRDKDKAEKKLAEKIELQELKKQAKAEAAAAKKRRRGDGAPRARKKRQDAKVMKADAEEKEEVKEEAAGKRGWLWWQR
jgi:hypothetical protein